MTHPKQTSTPVFTIGYEGTDIDRFIATLHAVNVDVLVDVRAVAISRKKGFSKSALRNRLESEGIAYQHFVELGDPKPGRDAARDGRIADFQKIYRAHLARDEARAALDALATLAREHSVCLLCYERDPKHCHRSIVTADLKSKGLDSFDLYGDLPRRYDNFSAKLPRRDSSQSVAAAE